MSTKHRAIPQHEAEPAARNSVPDGPPPPAPVPQQPQSVSVALELDVPFLADDAHHNATAATPLAGSERHPRGTASASDAPLIAFVNFKSGGKRGGALVGILRATLGAANVYNLAVVDPATVLEAHRHTPDLRVVACGGDGTVNWVMSTVARLHMQPLPKIGIIPLGTGNDTSRHFGWSHKLRDAETVVNYLHRMRAPQCPTRAYDRWTVVVSVPAPVSAETGARAQEQGASPSAAGEDAALHSLHPFLQRWARLDASAYTRVLAGAGLSLSSGAAGAGAGAHDGELHLSWSFNNYLSVGIDAQIMDSFQRHRESSPGCYCCRCCNMVWVGLFSPINCCTCSSRQLEMDVEYLAPALADAGAGAGAGAGSVTTIDASQPANTSDNGPLSPPSSSLPTSTSTSSWSPAVGLTSSELKAFVLLNLPSYAGGRDIWGSSDGRAKSGDAVGPHPPKPSSGDGLIEVLGFNGYNHMSATVMRVGGTRARRLGQVPGARFTLKDRMFAQLDGEAWTMDAGARVEVVAAQPMLMLVNEPADVQGVCCDC